MKTPLLALITHNNLHDAMLLLALAIYIAGARILWKTRGWPARGAYTLAAGFFVYYEIHMQLLWMALGVLSLTLAWIIPGRPSVQSVSDE